MTFEQLLTVFGRLHPMVLHLPIGLLSALAACEFVLVVRPATVLRPATRILAIISGACGGVTALSGLVLGGESSYDADAISLHKWLGLGLGAACVLLAIVHARIRDAGTGGPPRAGGAVLVYRLSLTLALLVMVPAGHLGASITHGDNFLLEPLRGRPTKARPGGENQQSGAGGTTRGPSSERGSGEASPQSPTDPATSTGPFATRILPLLREYCTSCHNAEKKKGGLELADFDSILAGGDGGPVIVAGDAGESELVIRMRLPRDDEDHMPPSKKKQPTPEEIAEIVAWIADGAKP